MAGWFWLTKPQIHRITSYRPLSHTAPRVDDRQAVSGIRNRLRWRDEHAGGGPHKALRGLTPPPRIHLRNLL